MNYTLSDQQIEGYMSGALFPTTIFSDAVEDHEQDQSNEFVIKLEDGDSVPYTGMEAKLHYIVVHISNNCGCAIPNSSFKEFN